MARKKYMAIHTFNSDEMKKAFFRGLHKSELTDFEWRDGYIFEKCQCTGTWVGDDDFFFCQWESENEEDVLKALTSKGMDKYIFTALYPIDMHIDIRNLTGKVPYEPVFYLDDEYNPEKG
jgi:hypothetical protein|tara:strand:+ start:92 stop:451 length:360 start_codon:yes stop_codon:yes gene_type:complete